MTITNDWLLERGACAPGIKWFEAQSERDGVAVVNALLAEHRPEWANWLVSRMLSPRGRIAYATAAAEMVLPFWTACYPDDDRPQRAIAAARAVLKRDTERNQFAAGAAARFAAAAADAAFAADAAACAAYYAAHYAAHAAYYAAYAAYYAAYAAADAACATHAAAASAAYAAAARVDDTASARLVVLADIVRYGLGLLTKEGA